MKTSIVAMTNQKGGVGKTTSCVNLGICMAQEGKKVLLADCDPQGSLTISLGWPQPDRLEDSLASAMTAVMMDEPYDVTRAILHHSEGVDVLPANIELSGVEVSMVNAMSRERVLKRTLKPLEGKYDLILLDCMPSLGMLTVNALAAANSVLIPVQAQYLSAKGLEQLLGTIAKVRRQINPKLVIDGVILTMVDNRTNYAREISTLVRETYAQACGKKLNVFSTEIPRSVRAEETSAEGKSIFAHDPKGKVAQAYRELTKEMKALERKKQHQLEAAR
ncbi:MAG: ParA family protein [Clostridia bacterium]|nr:ParA family protein [Clostridia bacterium]